MGRGQAWSEHDWGMLVEAVEDELALVEEVQRSRGIMVAAGVTGNGSILESVYKPFALAPHWALLDPTRRQRSIPFRQDHQDLDEGAWCNDVELASIITRPGRHGLLHLEGDP